MKHAAQILQDSYLMVGQDKKADEVAQFLHVFKLKKNYIFGDAEYVILKNRQVSLQKPEEMSSEDYTEVALRYCIDKLQQFEQNNNILTFTQIRDVCAARLTIFNGRRGAKSLINE